MQLQKSSGRDDSVGGDAIGPAKRSAPVRVHRLFLCSAGADIGVKCRRVRVLIGSRRERLGIVKQFRKLRSRTLLPAAESFRRCPSNSVVWPKRRC